MSDEPNTELDGEQAELVRRCGLSATDAQQIRGDTWAEKCDDAQRLAGLAEPQSIRERARRHLQAMQDSPNQGELAALAMLDHKHEQDAELVRRLHPPSPPSETEEP